MNILITNLKLTARSGTETYVRDLGLELLRRGHRPIVYSPIASGAIVEELRRATIPVVDRLERVGVTPDVIHGHHAHQTLAALLHFDRTPAVFVCHDYAAWHDEPPVFPRLLRYVAVDDTCLDRLVCENGIPESQVHVVLNFVDLDRFRPRPPLPARPARALVFRHPSAEHGFTAEIIEGCRLHGIPVDVVGGSSGRVVDNPEEILGSYDLVFAKGKAAQEALAVGDAVILCDKMGLGELVTVDRFEAMRATNFGRRQLQSPVSRTAIAAQIARYDASDAAEVSRRLRAHGGLAARVDELLQLYADVIGEHLANGAPDRDAERQAVAACMERIASTEAVIDADSYKRQNAELRAAQERTAEDLARLQAALDRRTAQGAGDAPAGQAGAWARVAARVIPARWRTRAVRRQSARHGDDAE
jgi:hypothetical protein